MAPTDSGSKKNTHGGARKGAGRPRSVITKNQTLGTTSRHRHTSPQQRARATTSTVSASITPSAFFGPYNTHHPVPLGNREKAPSGTPSGRASFWSAGPSHPEATSEASSSFPPHQITSPPLSSFDFSQLNEQLTFIEENDEHADIAAGDREIDESLVDDVVDNAETNANAAEAETQSSEATGEDSVLSKHLKSVKDRLVHEIEVHGRPLCYIRGDFYDRPPHPVFALHNGMAGAGLNPTQLYFRKICVWLPYLLPGCPDRLKCTCGLPLSRKGFNDNPIARRVRSMPADFFLFTNRMVCDGRRTNSPGCKKNFQGTDPHIIGQLPRFVQAAFPAYISARGAISKVMLWQMSNTFATRFGPAPFSELVSEIQHRWHADGELMYLAAADFYGQSKIEPYSAFNDPNGYAGSPPSVPYTKSLFTDYTTAHRIFVERDIAALPATVVCSDHTFAFLKYMGGLKGEPVFNAAYSMLNEHEEIRAHSLTQTKSLSFVEDMYKGVQEGLKNTNNPPTQLLYTDSPQSERSFHESLNSSLTRNVEPVTDWIDLPAFYCTPGIPTAFLSDSMEIEAAAGDILENVLAQVSSSRLSVVALAVKTQHNPGERPQLHIIQLRTPDKIIAFEVSALTSRSDILPSLRSLLTNPTIIKTGHSIRQTLQIISDTFYLPELGVLAKSKNAPILDLGQYARLKAVIEEPSPALDALTGVVLRKSFSLPYLSHYPWSLSNSERNQLLFREIDCQWQIYMALSPLGSLGLPLQPEQAVKHGQLVTLVHACKPVAEGSIVGHHPGFINAIMDDQGHAKKINVSASRSLITISKVLVPTAIHTLHKQTMEWIYTHGGEAVVTTSQLRTRGESSPVSSSILSRAFAAPAPPEPSHGDEDLNVSIHPPTPIQFDHWTEEMYDDSEEDSEDDADDNFEFDEHSWMPFEEDNRPDEMQEGESGFFDGNINEDTPANDLMDGIERTFSVLSQPDKFPTRVLDDAFHYMDRLLRLLSKKHSAFKAFARDFSEAIFIRDKSDELAVRSVLEKHGVSWEYAKRAKSSALNRRIRRYIPGRTVLLKRLETLFKSYENIQCSTKKGRGTFFSDEAKEMVVHLLDTVRKGYLSDPPGIPLYYLMGKDRDGLWLYRTIRGTNSIEGGFHMTVRRIFGSLRASPELAECLLINWILRRNKKVGFRNRTGKKYQGHHAIWVRDEIVELAIALGVKPSFPLPRVLSTRIATSETIGILPISKSLAEQYKITTLPRALISGIPHHRDTPVHTMTRLSTKPTNQYRYLQLRQRTLCAVVPVHTHKEYITFKANINHLKFRKGGKSHPAHEHHKNIDFVKFAQFWNELVDGQSRTVTDSNQRLYYKIPQQLEVHHKKTILWASERSTLASGSNFAARKPLLDILNSPDNHADVLAAIPLPESVPDGELDLSISAVNDPNSFNPMAEQPTSKRQADSVFNEDDDTESAESATTGTGVVPNFPPVPQPAIHAQLIPLAPVHQSLLPGASAPAAASGTSKPDPKRCALCVNALCSRRLECKGKGGRKFCGCKHPPLGQGQKARWSEEQVLARLARQAQGGQQSISNH